MRVVAPLTSDGRGLTVTVDPHEARIPVGSHRDVGQGPVVCEARTVGDPVEDEHGLTGKLELIEVEGRSPKLVALSEEKVAGGRVERRRSSQRELIPGPGYEIGNRQARIFRTKGW